MRFWTILWWSITADEPLQIILDPDDPVIYYVDHSCDLYSKYTFKCHIYICKNNEEADSRISSRLWSMTYYWFVQFLKYIIIISKVFWRQYLFGLAK